MEHLCVRFGYSSCIGFVISSEKKTNRQIAVNTLLTRLSSPWVNSVLSWLLGNVREPYVYGYSTT